jgi:nucleoside-diphosphate-sugar epimerase
MYKICLLGGNGYIGTRIQQFLENVPESLHITVVDRDKFTNRNTIDQVQMDVSNYVKQVDLRDFDCVILLAGQCSVASSSNLVITVQNNIVLFSTIADQLSNSSTLFVYASSSSVYGNTNNQVVDETYTNYTPYNYYDLSKQTIDHIAQLVPGLRYFGLRFGTVNGVARNFRTDLMINSMVNSAVNNGKINVSNPHINRPILYIHDLCTAVHQILRADIKKSSLEYGVYNLVSFNHSVLFIANTIEKTLKTLDVDCSVAVVDQDTTATNNTGKLNSKAYDFKITSAKFQDAFPAWVPIGTIDIIVKELYNCMKVTRGSIVPSNRSDVFKDCVTLDHCIVCNEPVTLLLDLGIQPLANDYHDNRFKYSEYPLKLMHCDKCFHNQQSVAVNPKTLFSNYLYKSGTSTTLKKYFENFAKFALGETRGSGGSSDSDGRVRVLDIACNDCSQLDAFYEMGCQTFGVDPAANLLYSSDTSSRHTLSCNFWNNENLGCILDELQCKTFDIIVAQNVFAHTVEIKSFLTAIKQVCNPSTRVYIQTSQAHILSKGEFDTIYHEHISFFTCNSMRYCVESIGMHLVDVEFPNIHGGSYLFTVSVVPPTPIQTRHIADIIKYEQDTLRIYKRKDLNRYIQKCESYKTSFCNEINTLVNEDYTIVGYGSTAKSNTLLNYCGLTSETVVSIVDDNPLKQGLYTPGSCIPIVGTDWLVNMLNARKDSQKLVIVVFAWNFYDEIKNKITSLVKGSACPVVHVLNINPIQLEHLDL